MQGGLEKIRLPGCQIAEISSLSWANIPRLETKLPTGHGPGQAAQYETVNYPAPLGIKVRQFMGDNGLAYCSRTNDKTGSFVQTGLRERPAPPSIKLQPPASNDPNLGSLISLGNRLKPRLNSKLSQLAHEQRVETSPNRVPPSLQGNEAVALMNGLPENLAAAPRFPVS
jgi:hypothetical protein